MLVLVSVTGRASCLACIHCDPARDLELSRLVNAEVPMDLPDPQRVS